MELQLEFLGGQCVAQAWPIISLERQMKFSTRCCDISMKGLDQANTRTHTHTRTQLSWQGNTFTAIVISRNRGRSRNSSGAANELGYPHFEWMNARAFSCLVLCHSLAVHRLRHGGARRTEACSKHRIRFWFGLAWSKIFAIAQGFCLPWWQLKIQ